VTDPELFTALPTGTGRDSGNRIVGEGLAEAVQEMDANLTALDLLASLINAARDHGLDVEPVLPAPLTAAARATGTR
jgi:hypothetical protein